MSYIYRIFFVFIFIALGASILTPHVSAAVTSGANTVVERGVNLFGGWQGIYGDKDAFATPEQLDYFKSKGLNTFRVGIAWEHLQPTLNGPFDATYLAKMDALVASASARGQKITFVPLPGKWKEQNVGTSAVPQAAFNDFWIKMATHYKGEPAIWGYSLLNEPGMGDVWNTTIAPSAIAAIRTVDMSKPIIVPTSTGGYGHYFNSHLVNLPMEDPANNLIYEAHFYFDTPPNGRYENGYDVPNNNLNIGVDNAKDFVEWCVANNQKCFAGEYGIPAGWKYGTDTCIYLGGTNKDDRWLTVLDNFLTYLDENNISGAYWAGGPYGDVNSVGPFCDTEDNFIDGPQMPILVRHLGYIVDDVTPPSSCPTDINQDGITNVVDYSTLARYFLKPFSDTPRVDINRDGTVNVKDYSLLSKKFLQACE